MIVTEYNKTYSTITLKKEGPIVTVIFNHPKRRMDDLPGMDFIEFGEAMNLINDDPKVRVVIFTGANDPNEKRHAFSAGGNVKYYYNMAQKGIRGEAFTEEEKAFRLYQSMKRKSGGSIPSLRQPTIAMVNGDAVGAGVTFVLACDIAICADTARFMHGYARIGLSSGGGGEWHWARKVGVRNACYMAFTSKFIDANEAKNFGIVHEVVPFADLEKRTYEIARTIAEQGPMTLARIKEILYASMDAPLTTIFGYTFHGEHVAYLSDEHAEAISAFNEKRKPEFKDPQPPQYDFFAP